MSTNQTHFCMCPDLVLPGTRAALINAFKWVPGEVVRVRFLGGDPGLRQRITRVAQEWTGPDMANLQFSFVDSGDAEIRIALQAGNGSWSYLGTQCRNVPRDRPTMNYGWLTPDSDDDELRRVVLHEFGHALGLIHEHQSPNEPIQWNRDAVIRDLSGPPNNWDRATIEHNIFRRYDPNEISSTPVDPDSIMMYLIPAAWTTNGFSVDLNRELSATDKDFIRSQDGYSWGV